MINIMIHLKNYDKCTKNTLTNKHTYAQTGKMAQNRQRAGESIWMQKVAPLRVAILAKRTKYRQRAGDIQNVVIIQIRCQCVHFWTYLNKQQVEILVLIKRPREGLILQASVRGAARLFR